MRVWATMDGIIAEIAEVPENWIKSFGQNHPNDFRKFGDAKNSRTVYRVSAVLEAIENGESFRDAVAKSLEDVRQKKREASA